MMKVSPHFALYCGRGAFSSATASALNEGPTLGWSLGTHGVSEVPTLEDQEEAR